MKMKYLVLAAALASFGVHNAQAQCCAPGNPATQASATDVQGTVKTVKLEVEGMTCGSCAASVTTALKQIDGVGTMDITFEKKGGTVEYNPAKVNEQTIVEAVNKTGFKAQPIAAEKS